jgi:hypothetical protein
MRKGQNEAENVKKSSKDQKGKDCKRNVYEERKRSELKKEHALRKTEMQQGKRLCDD